MILGKRDMCVNSMLWNERNWDDKNWYVNLLWILVFIVTKCDVDMVEKSKLKSLVLL